MNGFEVVRLAVAVVVGTTRFVVVEQRKPRRCHKLRVMRLDTLIGLEVGVSPIPVVDGANLRFLCACSLEVPLTA